MLALRTYRENILTSSYRHAIRKEVKMLSTYINNNTNIIIDNIILPYNHIILKKHYYSTSSETTDNKEKENLRHDEMSSSKSFMDKESPVIDSGQSIDGDVNPLLMLNAHGVHPSPYAGVNRLTLSPERGLGAFSRACFVESTYFNSRIRSLVFEKSATASALPEEECLPSDRSASSSPSEYHSPALSSPSRPMDGTPFADDDSIIHTLSCFIAVCAIKLNVDSSLLINSIQYVLNNNIPFESIRDLVMSGYFDERFIEGGAIPSSITDVVTPSSSVPGAGIPSSMHTVSHIPIDQSSVSDVPNQPLVNIDTKSVGFKFFIGTVLLMAAVVALSFYNGSSGVDLPTYIPT